MSLWISLETGEILFVPSARAAKVCKFLSARHRAEWTAGWERVQQPGREALKLFNASLKVRPDIYFPTASMRGRSRVPKKKPPDIIRGETPLLGTIMGLSQRCTK